MYFKKIRHPSNFRFADRCAGGVLQVGAAPVPARVRDLGEDVFHVELEDRARWPLDARLVRMHDAAFAGASTHHLGFDTAGTLQLVDATGALVLGGVIGACVGVCGAAWLVQLARSDAMRF